jgi:hypothetical protein
LFEEAAGVGLYRDRRRSTERRLEETNVDLSRVDDLIAEVQTQVRSLARQRKRAERHAELTARRFIVELSLAASEMAAWNERANVYYVEDNYPEASADSTLERVEGGFGIPPKKHYFGIRSMVPGLRGLAILDNDGKGRIDSDESGLRVVYWRRYEAENYFVTPGLLLAYVDAAVSEKQTELFAPTRVEAQRVLDQLVLERVFANKEREFAIYKQATGEVADLLWVRSTEHLKLSELAEEFFRRLAAATQTPMLLRKGELHRMVELVDPSKIDAEVAEKLDLLLDLWGVVAATSRSPR